MGAEGGNFTDKVTITPVINSLQEGWPTDPVEFTAMMNGLRYASFSRGSETVKGGVSAKYLLRAGNNFKIVDYIFFWMIKRCSLFNLSLSILFTYFYFYKLGFQII